ncbi:Hypothetical protein SRAE_1000192600 [Strongyloides ratti]|uniref:Uncharacterized protein n=1 Tax=Strongyloides ratti TaxID=34506 RepID=A0A090L6D5_STRRB|nr:Hypothetical protein SRAE_1000192600 [Strongyloides ratti]CEF63668.1 Hypothetical protein SRAE_1000192600 [Strongyloides ratti]
MVNKYVLKFLSTLPKNTEDKITFSLLILSLFLFFIIKIILTILFFQIQKGTCSTVICPDLQKIKFSELPLSIKILETIRPIGGTLSLILFELILLLLNVKRNHAKTIATIGAIIGSLKILVSIIETGSNIHSAKFIDTQIIVILNNLNGTFVLIEGLVLNLALFAVFYRYKLQMNDNLEKESISIKSSSKSSSSSSNSSNGSRKRRSSKRQSKK